MKSLLDINSNYTNVIKTSQEKRQMAKERDILLSLRRPYTPEEKEKFNRLSYLLQLQKEIDAHKKRKDKYIKKLINESIFVI